MHPAHDQSPSQTHGNCSESFYRKEVERDVKSAPSANAEEKRRMLDLLKRFEEDALDDSPLLGSDDEDDEAENLSVRLQGMDIGASAVPSRKLLLICSFAAHRYCFVRRAMECPDPRRTGQVSSRAQ